MGWERDRVRMDQEMDGTPVVRNTGINEVQTQKKLNKDLSIALEFLAKSGVKNFNATDFDSDWDTVSATAIATILNAVIKGKLKHDNDR